MAVSSNVLRTCGLLLHLIFHVHSAVNNETDLFINTIEVGSKNCDSDKCKYFLLVNGGEFLGHYPWRLTSEEGSKGSPCDTIYPDYELKEIETAKTHTKLEVTIPNVAPRIFFCVSNKSKTTPFGGEFVHQGPEYFLDPKNDIGGSKNGEKSQRSQETTTASKEPEKTSEETTSSHPKEAETEWIDLSHDTDVNYLSKTRPARHKIDDIELLNNDRFVPLNRGIDQYKNHLGNDDRSTNDANRSNNDKDISVNDGNRSSDDAERSSNDASRLNSDENSYEYVNRNRIINNVEKNNNDWNKLNNDIVNNDMIRNDNNEYDVQNHLEYHNNDINNDNLIINQNSITDDRISKYKNDISLAYGTKNGIGGIKHTKASKINYENDDMINIRLPRHAIQNLLDKSLNEDDAAMKSLKQAIDEHIGLRQPRQAEDNIINNRMPNEDLFELPKARLPRQAVGEGIIHLQLPKQSKENIANIRLPRQARDDFMTNLRLPRQARYDHMAKIRLPRQARDDHMANLRLPRQARDDPMANLRLRRQAIDDMTVVRAVTTQPKVSQDKDEDTTSIMFDSKIPVVIEGIRVEDSDKEPKIVGDGVPSILADSSVTLRLYGEGLTPNTVIAFTNEEQEYGEPCKFLLKGEYMVKEGSLQYKTALFDITAPSPITGAKLYICAKNLPYGTDPRKDQEKYFHQGTESWKMLECHRKLLPLWVTLILILVCLMFSALFSGLNLGLMSLDRTELKIIANTGSEQERKYARAIMPVRDHGNYLLCSILLGNVAVNSTFTILLDDLTSGLFAVIFSTLAIVLLGEITPQAICSRHGLMVGAKSIMVTKAVMAITAPLSFPVSKLLDYFLGEEIGNVYNRERLKELVKVTTDVNDLDNDEVNIISGALELRKKKVSEVMTKLEDVFMLPISSILDFETMSEIIKSGYSRIPVYEGTRTNIVTVLFIKDLAFVDPDDNTPLRTLCQYYQNPCNFVFEDVTLDVMFKQFKDGHKGHMAFVHRINNEGEGDPFYETVGLVTLEDVIEEMIQAEIVDETDVFLDNRSKRRRNRPQHKLQDFTAFAEKHDNQRIHVSPQLTLATFQFLSTSVDAFRPDTVSETVLRRLLKQDVIHYIKMKGKTSKDPTTYVFHQGKPVDYFVLILEGRVEVTVGRENLVFEAGPFTYFGVQALTQNVGLAESPTPSAMGSLQNINMDAMLRHTFVPDYSVRAITSVYYLTVKRSLYLAAKRATLMEKGNLSKGGTNEQFDTEVDKLLQSVDEDLSITGEHKTPSRQISPHPMPVSPAPRTSSLEPRNGHAYGLTDEQERLLK